VPMRMEDSVVPALPEGGKADLVFLCDVLDFVPEDKKEAYLLSIRGLLAPEGRLICIESRDHWETHLVDIQDAGFLQKRIAQIVAARRIMAFEADPAAAPPPSNKPAPSPLPEDTAEPPKDEVVQPKPANPPPPTASTAGGTPGYKPPLSPEEEFNLRANATGYDISGLSQSTQDSFRADKGKIDAAAARIYEEADDDDDDMCMLEENPEVPAAHTNGGMANGGMANGGMANGDMANGVGGESDDEDGCMLEENPDGGGGGAGGVDDDDDDGMCMLEDNPTEAPPKPSAEVESDDECMLEDN